LLSYTNLMSSIAISNLFIAKMTSGLLVFCHFYCKS